MWMLRLRRHLRKLPNIFNYRPRVRRQLTRTFRLVFIVFLFLLTIVFITPARNFVGYFFIPASWIPLSSGRILQMFYLEEQRFPVELGEGVTCQAVEGVIKTVNWQEIMDSVKHMRIYDDEYFRQLASHPEIYGATPEDVEILNERFYFFKPPLSAERQRQMRVNFRVFARAMQLFNITFFLSEGTMLGSYRHHGIIPWDDDLDLCMNGTDWLRVKQILHCIPGFDVDTRSYMMYKFFWKGGEPLNGDDFVRTPYIDIFFFTEDDEYMWALSRIKKHRIVFKKSDIFPLTLRPFEDQLCPVPKTIEHMCTTMYDPTTCSSRDFDHLKDRVLIPFYEYEAHPCKIFKNVYPFVERQEVVINGRPATLELRKIGKKVLSNYTVWH